MSLLPPDMLQTGHQERDFTYFHLASPTWGELENVGWVASRLTAEFGQIYLVHEALSVTFHMRLRRGAGVEH